ncbi:hypothetical protein ACFLZX_02785 [Nanoarchaeota archaeon]
MKKRGQISIEYMAVVGITTVLAIFLLTTALYYSNQTEDQVNTNQLDKISKEIVDKAESLYYFGEPSKTTLKVYIPKGIKQITVGPKEISFRVMTHQGETDVFFPSTVTLQGSISPNYGYHEIVIEAREGYVWINGT